MCPLLPLAPLPLLVSASEVVAAKRAHLWLQPANASKQRTTTEVLQ
jgi:hypothetical protein